MNEDRRRKLTSIVYAIRELDDFSNDDAKLVCRDCSPGYVTLTINKLVKHGFLDSRLEEKKKRLRWIESKLDGIESWIVKQVHGEQVKETPENQRPREVLLRSGAADLTLEQLLAILIRSGIPGESALQAARILANRFGERLDRLSESSHAELREISRVVRRDVYCQIMAGIELGRRVANFQAERQEPCRIRGSDDAVSYCSKHFHRLAIDGKQEEFHIVTLDTQNGPINHHLITVGTLDASLVHPREVFRPAIRDSASSVILVHNHPSGKSTPSREDHAVTTRLKEVGDLVGIRVLDHIIVARERSRSLLAEP
jgi:DNA repair protein RadC